MPILGYFHIWNDFTSNLNCMKLIVFLSTSLKDYHIHISKPSHLVRLNSEVISGLIRHFDIILSLDIGVTHNFAYNTPVVFLPDRASKYKRIHVCMQDCHVVLGCRLSRTRQHMPWSITYAVACVPFRLFLE